MGKFLIIKVKLPAKRFRFLFCESIERLYRLGIDHRVHSEIVEGRLGAIALDRQDAGHIDSRKHSVGVVALEEVSQEVDILLQQMRTVARLTAEGIPLASAKSALPLFTYFPISGRNISFNLSQIYDFQPQYLCSNCLLSHKTLNSEAHKLLISASKGLASVLSDFYHSAHTERGQKLSDFPHFLVKSQSIAQLVHQQFINLRAFSHTKFRDVIYNQPAERYRLFFRMKKSILFLQILAILGQRAGGHIARNEESMIFSHHCRTHAAVEAVFHFSPISRRTQDNAH